MDVLGVPQDNRGPVLTKDKLPIHRPAPSYDEQAGGQDLLLTGIKVIDLLVPFAKGTAKSVYSAVPASARPSTCSNSSTTSPSSTRVYRCLRASASAPVKATTFITR